MLINSDCLEYLKTLPDNHVDSIVTDPPYGLSFLGEKWDYDVPSVEIWKECLRVLKPGGHVLSFGGTRTYHRMVVNIEDAGFEIRDQIQWLYGQGFPKNLNVTKQFEKLYECQLLEPAKLAESQLLRFQVESNEGKGDSVLECVAIRLEVKKGLPMGIGVVVDLPGPTATYLYESMEKIDSSTLLSWKHLLEELSQKGSRSITLTRLKMITGLKIWNLLQYPSTLKSTISLNGTSLKPANEPICLARKPLQEKTVAQNVLELGTGALNIDGSRIKTSRDVEDNSRDNSTFDTLTSTMVCRVCHKPRNRNQALFVSEHASYKSPLANGSSHAHDYQQLLNSQDDCHPSLRSCDERVHASLKGDQEVSQQQRDEHEPLCCCTIEQDSHECLSTSDKSTTPHIKSQGRFPANVILDEEAGRLLDEQSGVLKSGELKGYKTKESENTCMSGKNYAREHTKSTGGTGGASRFFYCAKASKGERDGSNHPTMKPLKLMKYLVTMITPPGGTVLDPFMGSGTTCLAAEELGFDFIGIEKEAEYFEIAKRRLGKLSLFKKLKESK